MVWLPSGASAEAVFVRIGLTDGTFTEVLGNKLSEGSKVITEATVNGKSAGGTPSASPGQPRMSGGRSPGGMGRMF